MADEAAPDRFAALAARLADLADREEIRARLTAFSRGMDRFDRDIFLSAFWPDAEMAAGPYVGSVAGCWDWAVPLHQAWQVLTQHSLLNTTIEITGDTAHVETYYLFVARNRPPADDPAETLWLAGGRYLDRFERRDGDAGTQWRIALRTNLIEWAGDVPPMPLPFADIADIAGNGESARDHSDPSYRRPLINARMAHDPGA